MTLLRLGCALVAALAALLLFDAGASAATVTFFDPASKSFITYDPDRLRSPGARRERPARQRAARRRAPTVVARIPAAPPAPVAPPVEHSQPGPEFDRQMVDYETTEEPGTIVIDTQQKFLYYVMEGGQAIRYGVGVGKEGFGWTGIVQIGALQEWPKWFPPAEMVQRRPELAQYQKVGMAGGEGNPLGARALYLHDDKGKDTLFRIHGTNEPWSIGLNVSSGCIRMLNENVTELYGLAKIGAKVIVT